MAGIRHRGEGNPTNYDNPKPDRLLVILIVKTKGYAHELSPRSHLT